jgi:pimeloyl-ACP methyl ester carboxylesterase
VTPPRHHFFHAASSSGFHRIHYTEWGAADNPKVLICAHGLTRCGRDFDVLAQAMMDQYRVICPDVAGRGESDWLSVKSDYNYVQYMSDMNALITRVAGVGHPVHWVGTSMGGIIGMLLASQPESPIARMVINDVGSFIPRASIARIGQYLGAAPRFADFASAVMAVRAVSPFGDMSDDTWARLTAPLVKQHDDGTWQFRYDPGIAESFKQTAAEDVDLSLVWRKVACPVLLLRGADSDLLLRETFDKMCRKPGVRGVEFPNVGHAPMLQSEDQISVVRTFLVGE